MRMLVAFGVAAAAFLAVGAAVPALADQREDFLAGKTNDCPKCDLTRVNRKRGDLTNANLAGANLTEANFHDAKLMGADLTGATLVGANMNKADLRNAKLG